MKRRPDLTERARAAWRRKEELLRIMDERFSGDSDAATWDDLYATLSPDEYRELSASQLCGVCEKDTRGSGDDYMVLDRVWREAGMVGELEFGYLCVRCLELRLGRQLGRRDFKRVAVNDPRLPGYKNALLLRRLGA